MKPGTEILVWGANYDTCPLEVRERLALPSSELGRALDTLSDVTEEAVVLSTCHRLEVYALLEDSDGAPEELARRVGRWSGLDPNELLDHSYLMRGREATRHLFTVSSGLDSVVAGEAQVLGQVRGALEHARTSGTAGPILTALFDHAVSTGKRVRTETSLGRKDASLSAASVRHAHEVLGGLKGRRALIVGAGKMALLAAQSLRERGASDIVIVSRTPESAQETAAKVHGTASDFERLEEALSGCDVVISCTASPHYVLPYAAVSRSASLRQFPLLIMDLAMPRDVDPRVKDVDGVVLLDVDDFKHAEVGASSTSADDVLKARSIVHEAVREFEVALREREAIPTVTALYQCAERVREQELARSVSSLHPLTDAERDTLDAMTRAIVRKLLHTPVTQLKQAARDGDGHDLRELAGQLFGFVETEETEG